MLTREVTTVSQTYNLGSMKDKTLAIIVLLFMVGMITLVGTAFSAWLFRGAF